jgi:23S rRNA (adenine2030-N6)-methyltransferase
MNYRHVYHAGNFADTFKHIVLVALINSLKRKDSAFSFLDTHAGTGIYDLTTGPSQKGHEYLSGIERVRQMASPPPLIADYLECVKALNPKSDALTYYPGSPSIVEHLMRAQDRAILTELHEEDWETLKNNFHYDTRIAVHHQDAYQGLKAFLPPKERRGLVLIDPPYEKPNELDSMNSVLGTALKRWETGIYALWYPIKLAKTIERFHHAVKQNLDKKVLVVELSVYPENTPTHLNGSGMLIVNPPWKLDEELKAIMPALWKALSPNQQGRYEVKFL